MPLLPTQRSFVLIGAALALPIVLHLIMRREPRKLVFPALRFVEQRRTMNQHRLRLRLEIEDGAKKLLNTVFVLDEGGMVLSAGQRHLSGLLVLGLRCETAS